MTPFRILVPAFTALTVISCAPQKTDSYDTANPSGVDTNPAAYEASNPIYDTPAAYEETSAATSSTPIAPTPSNSANPNASISAAPATSSNGAAIIHTVVAGDTLSGISAKYKVPSAAIKQANSMTKDTVVLGRKMVIPPVR